MKKEQEIRLDLRWSMAQILSHIDLTIQIQSDMIRVDPACFSVWFETLDQEWMAKKFFHDIWSNLTPIDSKFEGEEDLNELYKKDTEAVVQASYFIVKN